MRQTFHEAPPFWAIAGMSAVRAAFGVIWTINAYLTWRPEFAAQYVGYLQNATAGQPDWLQPWFGFWLGLVALAPGLFVGLTRLIETLIAVCLLAGLARKSVYVAGALFSLLIWSTAEGSSGPYVAGATNLGPAFLYTLVFVSLIVFNRAMGETPYSLDFYLERRWPIWKRVAESAPPSLLERLPARLPWPEQGLALAGIVVAIALLLGGLSSALAVAPATPANAAAAVSPLSLASAAPEATARDAGLPPLFGTGPTVAITLEATDTQVTIANDVTYQAWTFGGSVPGPTLHVRQGQTVNVTFVNHGNMPHSIDFHAAEVPPDIAYRNVDPGGSLQFSFVATTLGAFLYHCGTAPVLLHIGNGMYGALLVDPAQPLPPADASYVLVQSEWYTRQVNGNVMAGDFAKMQAATPDEVVFNGVAFQYRDQPLATRAGQRARLYVVNAGPNLTSAFHVIGGIFAAVYPDGDPAHRQAGVSTYPVAPGQGVVFDIVLAHPGMYPFVDHSMRDMNLGAAGVLAVSP